MEIFSNKKRIEQFVDSMIEKDKFINLSICEGYITREEYVIATWIDQFCNENCQAIDQSDLIRISDLLPQAYKYASEIFGISVEKAEELLEKSRDIRARNMKYD
ncbi:MAG TPA: hypothetical protein P5277_04815 [Candidatus Paceibacterota bacterium]|nr:hypothetical protein [Candidatus Paceibacterota bacterium]